jgi:hypothetical protein
MVNGDLDVFRHVVGDASAESCCDSCEGLIQVMSALAKCQTKETHLEDRISDLEQLPRMLRVLGKRLADIDLRKRRAHMFQPDGNDIVDRAFRDFGELVFQVVKRVDGFTEEADGGRLHGGSGL